MRIVIIIPTYNEALNIELLILALKAQFHQMNHEMIILVVDDNSPDGTADKVRTLMAMNGDIHLIIGEKQGLGKAYIRGIKYALKVLEAEAIMEMDADFSHQPEDVPRLIAALEEGYDFVIGSRYIKGGKIPWDWGHWRTFLSRWGNIFARYVAGLSIVHDCTAGFRAIKASLLDRIDLEGLQIRGYAFQIALLNQAFLHNAVVKEVPVEFKDRVKGSTKLGLRDIGEFFLHVWQMRFQNNYTFIKFILVGLSGVFVNLGFFIFLIYVGISKFIASALAIEVTIISNFTLNNYWSFGERDVLHSFFIKGVRFQIVSTITLLISYLTFLTATCLIPHFPPYIHQLIALIPASILNYICHSKWTFNENKK